MAKMRSAQLRTKKKEVAETNWARRHAGLSELKSRPKKCLRCDIHFQSWKEERLCKACAAKNREVNHFHEGF